MTAERKYPIGIQTFSEIIRGGYLYVDKTDLVWQLAHYAKYIFLSRPRRFGKSLLSSTLHSYFAGQKELFEGLKIMELEQEWECYPVLHFDLSGAKHMPVKGVREELSRLLDDIESIWGTNPRETTPGMRFAGMVNRVFEQTGRQVAVIIDEYDAPLLDVLHEDESLQDMREVMQEFYQRLKMLEPKIKFCFITGITKFPQLSIFSTINNLTNVTMDSMFASICGITENELTTTLKPDVERLASLNKMSYDEMHQKLKLQYDGYRFVEDSEEIYNPFSLLKAFQQRKVSNYWFESGTPTFLIRQMQHFHTDITSLDYLEEPADSFDVPTEAMTTALPLLYQSGYLTIKGYDNEAETYMLSIPNQEVRIGYTKGLLPTYTGLENGNVQTGFALKFRRALKKDDIRQALEEMKAYLAGIPYVEGFKKKLEDPARAEGFYEYTFYLIFSMLNVYARTQVKCAKGRADIVVWMPNAIYVMELKVNDTAESALRQIDEKGYAKPFATDGRKIVKVGIKFSPETMTVEDWVIKL
ncbi:MAG: ATP-binding protein [Bacteroidaceae bacterium]|nr:ATP-binding protein [Bacteroidaceae bacterium]